MNPLSQILDLIGLAGNPQKDPFWRFKRDIHGYLFMDWEMKIFHMNQPNGQKTFGTSMSFDLELPAARKARKKKEKGFSSQPADQPDSGDVDCPGCGHGISKDTWHQALVGFVSGARSYAMGEPVRGDVVQTLRNTVSNMELPQPRDVWELSIVSRLTSEFDLLLQEGIEQAFVDMGELYTREEVDAYGARVQAEAFAQAEQHLAAEIEADLRAGLEHQLRREIEQELWKQFDEELARRAQD
mgnify:CR=1 FL=1